MNYSNRNDLCLLILLPVNDAARIYCNQIKSSLICQIKIDSNRIQNGLIYTCIQQKNQNNNLLNSLKNLTIEKNIMKQRQVKINKKFLSSSPITTDSYIPHTFSLWYSNKKKNIANGHDYIVK